MMLMMLLLSLVARAEGLKPTGPQANVTTERKPELNLCLKSSLEPRAEHVLAEATTEDSEPSVTASGHTAPERVLMPLQTRSDAVNPELKPEVKPSLVQRSKDMVPPKVPPTRTTGQPLSAGLGTAATLQNSSDDVDENLVSLPLP